MGDEIASLVADVKIKYGTIPGKRGGSAPWGTIYIPLNDTFQGGYNLEAYRGVKATETGRVGLESHELWHQVQYKRSGVLAFSTLALEFLFNAGGKNPYLTGDPVNNPGILNTVKKLSDISTLEGQAQFAGQWNADVYECVSGSMKNKADIDRLKTEADIILYSGINSQAARDTQENQLGNLPVNTRVLNI